MGFDLVPEEIKTQAHVRIITFAPQQEVLAHAAVRAFVSHGGMNSINEARPDVSYSLLPTNCLCVCTVCLCVCLFVNLLVYACLPALFYFIYCPPKAGFRIRCIINN